LTEKYESHKGKWEHGNMRLRCLECGRHYPPKYFEEHERFQTVCPHCGGFIVVVAMRGATVHILENYYLSDRSKEITYYEDQNSPAVANRSRGGRVRSEVRSESDEEE